MAHLHFMGMYIQDALPHSRANYNPKEPPFSRGPEAPHEMRNADMKQPHTKSPNTCQAGSGWVQLGCSRKRILRTRGPDRAAFEKAPCIGVLVGTGGA